MQQQLSVLVPGRGRPYLDGDSLDLGAPLVATIERVMTPEACAHLIARIDELGPSAAPITTSAGYAMRPDVRNNQRVIFDDVAFARELYAVVASHVPARLCGMRPVGLNERFRCYRYEPGHRFAPHVDGAFVRDDRERSLLTFMVYLNEGFTGGATTFLDEGLAVRPKTGMALLFQHLQLHEGSVVESGVKYVLRSDVMYTSAS